MRGYLPIEAPDTKATVDFLGKHPCTVTLTMDDKGELWVKIVSATQEAKIVEDELYLIPERDEDDEE